MRRPSHSTIVAYLALFVALGGTAAVALPGSNSVDSGDIKNNAVKGKDVNERSLKGVLNCPRGTRGRGGICFDRTDRSQTDWQGALVACSARRLRLPTVSEGLVMVSALPRDGTQYWVADSETGDARLIALNEVGFGPNITSDNRTFLHTYRCVTSPRD